MGKWDSFNEKVNNAELEQQLKEARENNIELPNGEYVVKIEKMAVVPTKSDGRPMFSVMCRIMEGEHKKKCLFMNKVIAGTKNDGSMIAAVEGWLAKLKFPFPTIFNDSYDDFENLVMDCMEDIEGVEIRVSYNAKAFNSISILEVLE